MKKRLVIMTKSAKHGGYCVVGYDLEHQEWIRLVSSDKNSDGALFDRHLIYDNRDTVKCFDEVEVDLLQHQPKPPQVENYLINESVRFKKIKHWDYLHRSILSKDVNLIFNNTNGTLYLSSLEYQKITRSIICVLVKNAKIYISTNSLGQNKAKIDFQYNGKQYNYFSVTDCNFFQQNIEIPKSILIITLPTIGFSNINTDRNTYYKFVAKIIPLK